MLGRIDAPPGMSLVELSEYHYGKRWLAVEGSPELLFTENETNAERLFQQPNRTPYVKDAFHRYVVNRESGAVNPAMTGTKAAAHFASEIPPGKELDDSLASDGSQSRREREGAPQIFGSAGFDEVFSARQKETDEFYAARNFPGASPDARLVQRQAFAGLLWNKQSYHYEVRRWLEGDSTQPPPDPAAMARAESRLAASLQLRCHFHAGQVGIPLVRRVGFGVSLRRDGAGRSRFREAAAHPVSSRVVHAPERAASRLRVEFLGREPAGARVGGLARL